MTLAGWESAVRLMGIGLLVLAWVGAGVGAASGAGRRAGRATGLAHRYRAHVVYLLGAIPYFGICVLLWRPLPGTPSASVRVVLLTVGVVLGGIGAALYLLGRHELGRMYNVSSSLGCELYADHVLVTTGPFAYVRHPMYVGLALAAVGGLAVYRTWTLVFMCVMLAGAAVKARLEERLLAARFGPAWQEYATDVAAWLPRIKARRTKEVPDGKRSTAAS